MTLPIVGNLRRAAWDRKTVTIGGGDFGPEELKQAARMIENHDELLTALQALMSDPSRKGLLTDTVMQARAAIARATSKD
jgi:hypothetical protein